METELFSICHRLGEMGWETRRHKTTVRLQLSVLKLYGAEQYKKMNSVQVIIGGFF